MKTGVAECLLFGVRRIKKVTMVLSCLVILTGCAKNVPNEKNDNAFFPFGRIIWNVIQHFIFQIQ